MSGSYLDALTFIWERSAYDRGFISNPFSGPSGPERGLLRTRAVLDALGAPDRDLPIVHVAGSKGKGSTCAYLASIGRSAGYRTGLYTSPHLHSFRERIAIGSEPIDEPTFAALTTKTRSAVRAVERDVPELGEVTAFELLTALAMLAFAEANCDLAIIEVGLGGTWDATNVVHPKVAVITKLDLEHTNVLGSTIAEIAANKAGIIESLVPTVTAAQDADAQAVIEARARDLHAPMFVAGDAFRWSGTWRDFAWEGFDQRIERLGTGMPGAHQVENASLAIAAWQLLTDGDLAASADIIRSGIRQAALPGRFERVTIDGRHWIFDGAHTPVAAAALAAELAETIGRPITAIVGMLDDKDAHGFLVALSPAIRRLILTAPRSPRARSVDDLLPIAHSAVPQVTPSKTMQDALEIAQQDADTDPILVTGSFSVVAEAREELGLAKPDPPVQP